MSDQRFAEQPPSGRQFELACGPWRATVVEVGAGLRMLSVDGREILDGYSRHDACTGARGLPLITSLDRPPARASTTENTQLLRSQRWVCRGRGRHHVLMGVTVNSSNGAGNCLDVSVEYRLGVNGLTVRTTASNLGVDTCSYAAAHQPYLKFGARIDACRLGIAADRYVLTDPLGATITTQAVGGSELDFADGVAYRSSKPRGRVHGAYTATPKTVRGCG